PNSREATWTSLKRTEALRSRSASAKALSSCRTALVRSSGFLKSYTENGNSLSSSASPHQFRAGLARRDVAIIWNQRKSLARGSDKGARHTLQTDPRKYVV